VRLKLSMTLKMRAITMIIMDLSMTVKSEMTCPLEQEIHPVT
jgi:hypothetical protein